MYPALAIDSGPLTRVDTSLVCVCARIHECARAVAVLGVTGLFAVLTALRTFGTPCYTWGN